MSDTNAHALVFGASGLAGWGIVDQLLSNYPTEGTFSKVTALVNRPLTVEESHWPAPSRPALDLVSGINLLDGFVENFTATLQTKVRDVDSVTHVFYFAYKQEDDAALEVKLNFGMFERVLGAVESLCPKLAFVIFPSGSKAYGIQIPGGVFAPPYKESVGRIPEPAASNIYYYEFHRLLTERSKGKNWTWCDVRPDAIIGFAPNGSAFNLTAHWANYLSLYALVEGNGAKVPFPGTDNAYKSLFNEASAEMIAKFSIWASLHPSETGGQAFNIADQTKPSSMAETWPKLCKYFGLEGVGPVDDPEVLLPGEYMKKHEDALKQSGVAGSVVFKANFLDTYGYYLSFDRHFCLDKLRLAGFQEEIDPVSSWFRAFDRFWKAEMIPG